MELTRTEMMDLFQRKDPGARGRFIIGVVTTGIYCLPTCPARRPKEENVRFYETEDRARAAGLRPCLRCRPDHYYREYDPDLSLLEEWTSRIREAPESFRDVSDLVRRSGVGRTRLHSLFRRCTHRTPSEFLHREKIRKACELLNPGGASVLQASLDSGYESLSSFHEQFRAVTCMTPGTYRDLGRDRVFVMRLPEDYRWDVTASYLGRDPDSPCERVEGGVIRKSIRIGGRPVILSMEARDGEVLCGLEGDVDEVRGHMREVHAGAVRLLGLGADPGPFERQISRDPELALLVDGRTGLRVPQTPTVFEGLVWVVCGQQVHLKAAFTMRRRLIERAGIPLGGGFFAHPGPEEIGGLEPEDLVETGLSRRKAETLLEASRAIIGGRLDLERLPDETAPAAEKTLLGIRGLGPWSAGYLLMRACGFGDAVPVGDSALETSLQRYFHMEERPRGAKSLEALERFSPHRGLAVFHLWMWNHGG